LIGYWSDILPSKANGSIHLFRDLEEYEKARESIVSDAEDSPTADPDKEGEE
jgi:hypothetical protein